MVPLHFGFGAGALCHKNTVSDRPYSGNYGVGQSRLNVPEINELDETAAFRPVKIAVMTVSDTRTTETDTSGATLIGRLESSGHLLARRAIVADDQSQIENKLRTWIAADDVEVVLLTGGTGLTGRDVTPEAVIAVANKQIPGFGELFRHLSYAKIGTSTIQSRAMGAVAGNTLLFALPGSTGACKDAWDMILKQQLDVRHRPCNFVQMLPRLIE